ncbi:MAG: SUMF1/EgtB/PvdO family nonheme iron enzyme [Desulfobacterales bacterium]|nr:SUMF1/EgtB/PvdO family nonheme iron enzyme [Desulfobacterales bacterium]
MRIEAGSFMMGNDRMRDKYARDNEQLDIVELSEYYISRYPVTVAQFRAFIQDSGFRVAERWCEYNKTDNHPVVIVSWDDAVKYCEWLTEKLKQKGYT